MCLTNLAFHAAPAKGAMPQPGSVAGPGPELTMDRAAGSMASIAVGAAPRLCALLLAHSAPRAQMAAAQALANSTRVPRAREALRTSGMLDLLVTAVLEALAVRLMLLQSAQEAAEAVEAEGDQAGPRAIASDVLSAQAHAGMAVLRACVGLLVNLCGDLGGRVAVRGAILD